MPAKPPAEWSSPMTKKELRSRLRLGVRAFETFARSLKLLERQGRQLWRIRLDLLDAKSRARIETDERQGGGPPLPP